MINSKQFLTHIVIPYTNNVSEEMCSAASNKLLMGTCAQESKMATYVKQINGPAFGPYQCEPATFLTIMNYLERPSKTDLKAKILKVCNYSQLPDVSRLASDFGFATIICRLCYWIIPEKLPDAENLQGLAEYWKKYYNTEHGKGTATEFVTNYRIYV